MVVVARRPPQPPPEARAISATELASLSGRGRVGRRGWGRLITVGRRRAGGAEDPGQQPVGGLGSLRGRLGGRLGGRRGGSRGGTVGRGCVRARRGDRRRRSGLIVDHPADRGPVAVTAYGLAVGPLEAGDDDHGQQKSAERSDDHRPPAQRNGPSGAMSGLGLVLGGRRRPSALGEGADPRSAALQRRLVDGGTDRSDHAGSGCPDEGTVGAEL